MHRRYGRSRRSSCPCLTTVVKVARVSASHGRGSVRSGGLSGVPDGQRSRQPVAKRSAKGAIMLSRSQSLSEGGAQLTDQEWATALLDRLRPSSCSTVGGRVTGSRRRVQQESAPPPGRLHRRYRLQGKGECAMTSRTNRHSGGRNQGDPGEGAPSDLEQRRQRAVERYLAGDPIAVICQELGCAKSWLYKWKHRYQATEPAWF